MIANYVYSLPIEMQFLSKQLLVVAKIAIATLPQTRFYRFPTFTKGKERSGIGFIAHSYLFQR